MAAHGRPVNQPKNQAGILFRYIISHPDQLSLLPSSGWEMSTGQTAVKLCGWRVKAVMALST